MTSHAGRLYALALALLVFFLAWAVVAARPWKTSSPDPRLQALALRQAQLRQDAKLVQQIVARRRTTTQAAARAAAPAVRVVNLPPLTITRSS